MLDQYIVLGIVITAVILFVTEALAIDLVAILIMIALVVTGVLAPDEAIAGFSNPATITVAFMFVLSAALLKTGALQIFATRLGQLFQKNYTMGLVAMMLCVAVISAFINNTPVVAVLIPVVIQIARTTKIPASKLLIPLSFASIFGGTCTLIGTSTNILVSGIAKDHGIEEFGIFEMAPIGLCFVVVGILYMIFFGNKLLPKSRKAVEAESNNTRDYIAEFQILPSARSVGLKIMDSPLIREMKMYVIEIRRGEKKFTLPAGDMRLEANDILKVRCDVDKIKQLKEEVNASNNPIVKMGDGNFDSKGTTLVEFVIRSNSEFNNKTLKQIDFRRKYRAVPLAITRKEEELDVEIKSIPLKPGDVILAEVKTHFTKKLFEMEKKPNSPFIILSEEKIVDFNEPRFWFALAILAGVVISAVVFGFSIMFATIIAVSVLVLFKSLSMKEVYSSINWSVVFLLAGSLSLGVAMDKTGLAKNISESILNVLQDYGIAVVLAGIYLITSVFTDLMSNNATAALIAPIAIATANGLGVDPKPFLIAVMMAASASFMTPIGYQTNTMVYSAGRYKFLDFFKVGFLLNILFLLIAVFLIPILYGLS